MNFMDKFKKRKSQLCKPSKTRLFENDCSSVAHFKEDSAQIENCERRLVLICCQLLNFQTGPTKTNPYDHRNYDRKRWRSRTFACWDCCSTGGIYMALNASRKMASFTARLTRLWRALMEQHTQRRGKSPRKSVYNTNRDILFSWLEAVEKCGEYQSGEATLNWPTVMIETVVHVV